MAVGYCIARKRPRWARSSGARLSDVLALEQDTAAGHLVARVAHQRVGERALAGAVRPHDRVHFAGRDRQRQALDNLLALDLDPQVFDSAALPRSCPSTF